MRINKATRVIIINQFLMVLHCYAMECQRVELLGDFPQLPPVKADHALDRKLLSICGSKVANVQDVRQLLDDGANVHVRANSEEETPLHWAAYRGHKEIIELLIERGSEAHAIAHGIGTYVMRDWDQTPLFYALYGRHGDCALLLILKTGFLKTRNQIDAINFHIPSFRLAPEEELRKVVKMHMFNEYPLAAAGIIELHMLSLSHYKKLLPVISKWGSKERIEFVLKNALFLPQCSWKEYKLGKKAVQVKEESAAENISQCAEERALSEELGPLQVVPERQGWFGRVFSWVREASGWNSCSSEVIALEKKEVSSLDNDSPVASTLTACLCLKRLGVVPELRYVIIMHSGLVMQVLVPAIKHRFLTDRLSPSGKKIPLYMREFVLYSIYQNTMSGLSQLLRDASICKQRELDVLMLFNPNLLNDTFGAAIYRNIKRRLYGDEQVRFHCPVPFLDI